MPYSTIEKLPDAVQKMPKHAQEIYMKAFNNAFKQYEGNEGRSHATAWAAVEKSFEKKNGRWVAKESIALTEAELSANDKRVALEAALKSRLGIDNFWIEDVWDGYFVYSHNQQSYKASYSMTEDGAIDIGTPEKVLRQTSYKSVEALQSVYSNLLYEAGKRNAMSDSSRIKKIMELCQELLSSEGEPDIKALKKAIGKVGETLTWLKAECPVVRIEEDVAYPIGAFAYTPDSDAPPGWKLRLFDGDNLSRFRLNTAAAYLSTGGYKGQYIQMAESALPEVKRRIRTGYRALDVPEIEIPKWVKEVETRQLLNSFTSLTEAEFEQLGKGRATVIVIKPGFNTNESRYYPAEMLKRDYKIFEGVKMFADHPTDAEDKARPERSIRDWVATLEDVSVDGEGVVTGLAVVHEGWLKAKLAALGEKGMLPEMGVSINAIGSATKGKIDGKDTLIIEKLVAARSVDFVTEPGAGGVVTFYESDRVQDVDLIDLATLKEKRPDLVENLELEFKTRVTKEVKTLMESEVKIKGLEEEKKNLESEKKTLTTENDDLKTKIADGEKAKAKTEAQAKIKTAVDESTLPAASKTRLVERFKDAESDDGIKEAIKSELEYIAELAESGKVKGIGPSTTDSEADTKAMREAVKRTNPDWNDAQVEAFVTGR